MLKRSNIVADATELQHYYRDVNTGNRDAVLFSHTDAPVMRALGLWREEPRA